MFPRAKRVSLGLAQPGDSPLYGTYIELAHASENSAFVIADEIRRFHSNFDCFRFGSHPVHPSAPGLCVIDGWSEPVCGRELPPPPVNPIPAFLLLSSLVVRGALLLVRGSGGSPINWLLRPVAILNVFVDVGFIQSGQQPVTD